MKQMIRVLSFAALAGLLAGCGEGYVLIDSKGQVGIEQRNLIYIQIVMMLLVVMSVPNSFEDTSATACLRSSSFPLAIVADVPMHCILGPASEALIRRTRSATSAPWRPR